MCALWARDSDSPRHVPAAAVSSAKSLFARFDEAPIAAASLAQVLPCRLSQGVHHSCARPRPSRVGGLFALGGVTGQDGEHVRRRMLCGGVTGQRPWRRGDGDERPAPALDVGGVGRPAAGWRRRATTGAQGGAGGRDGGGGQGHLPLAAQGDGLGFRHVQVRSDSARVLWVAVWRMAGAAAASTLVREFLGPDINSWGAAAASVVAEPGP